MKRLSSVAFVFAAWTVATVLKTAYAAEHEEPPLDSREEALISWLENKEPEMLSLLEQITNINSGSLNISGLDAVHAVFSQELQALGFNTSVLPGGFVEMPHCAGNEPGLNLADHLLASRQGDGTRLLLMGHMDTVFPQESSFQQFSRAGNILRGPGVFDMKGGLVVMLYALKSLHETGLLENRSVSVLLNSDEEVGSLSSRIYLEQQAVAHDYGLVFEGSSDNNQVRERKGLGQIKMIVNGRASHAGSAHEDGLSAITELAYKIIEMESMTDYETGLTVNVGMINGGEARNMVAPCAEAFVDLRYPTPELGAEAEQQFAAIARTNFAFPDSEGRISTELWVNLHRPPKIPTAESDYLLLKTIAIGRLLGEQIGVSDSGGGTDGSLTQAVGLPTIDSLGLNGLGGHSQREEVTLDSLLQSTRRAAVLIHRLLNE